MWRGAVNDMSGDPRRNNALFMKPCGGDMHSHAKFDPTG
jgi:hypothetical protein